MKLKFKDTAIGFIACLILVIVVLLSMVGSLKNIVTILDYANYYDFVTTSFDGEIDQAKMDESVYAGITNGLGDEHSTYIPKADSEQFDQLLNTSNAGIGVKINSDTENNAVIIQEVFDGSGAQAAKLYPGDQILAVNDVTIDETNIENIVAMIKEKDETKLLINRQSENREFEVVVQNGEYEVPSLSYTTLEDNGITYGYIDIDSFSNTTSEEFEVALADLESQNIEGLMIDVRQNGGGYLGAVTGIADQIVMSDRPFLYVKRGDKVQDTYTSKLKEPKPYPIVGIQDENSASASEILMGALKEVNQNEIIGTTSYGKGSVQATSKTSKGGIAKITVDHWFTADDNSIQDIGIEPTVSVDAKTITTAIPIVLSENLEVGDSSLQSAQVNYYLYNLGYATEMQSMEFTQKTKTELIKYQKSAGLKETGIVDIYTAESLYKDAKNIEMTYENDPFITSSLEALKK